MSFADFSSSSFNLENPLSVTEGGQATSSSFKYFGSTGQLIVGESSSTNFKQNSGFMYFPFATSPVLTATAGDTTVSLSWTAASGVFANVTSYELGSSTSADSGFVYVSVGTSTSSTKSSLTNGTTYYFKVRSYAAGILVSESSVVSSTPASSDNGGSGGGGGGGGGGSSSGGTSNNVKFSGRAYPRSTVVLLKDAQVLTSTLAGNDANFTININSMNAGNYIFSVYSEDDKGNRSSLLTFPVSITAGASTDIGGIFIAPTIATDKSEVKQGDNITFFGQSTPNSEITISIHSEQELFEKTNSDKDGIYLRMVDSSPLEVGSHSAKSKSAINGEISSYSKPIDFAVSDKNIENDLLKKCPAKGDLNNDCKVNLIDFSIAAFWNKKTLTQSISDKEKLKLNGDGKINLIDFSIMAYYWTG
ncbi:MAG: dockerin type I repeat-containing protein [Candidatus Paceibacterota bacterium]